MDEMIKSIKGILDAMPSEQRLAALALCVTIVVELAILTLKLHRESWAKAWLGITGAVIVLNVGVGLARGKPIAAPDDSPVSLRLRFDAPQSEVARPTMLLWHERPVDLGRSVLEVVQPGDGTIEYRAVLGQLPHPGEKYEGRVFREVTSAEFGDRPPKTPVCFVSATPKRRVAERAITMACVEGHECQVNDLEGLAASCSSPGPSVAALSLLTELLPQAYAETNSNVAPPARGWIVPSLDTLKKRQQSGDGSAYTEFTLRSPPIPGLRDARKVQFGVRVNDTSVWIDGLPAEANSADFDAGKGLMLQIGMENLGFSGADAGKEDVEISLHFRGDKGQELRAAAFHLAAVALRNQPTPTPVGDADLGITWTARYVPQANDKFQVFVMAVSSGAEAVAFKKRFDEAHLLAAEPLLAVIRPPYEDNARFGIAVGTLQPSGQVRFSFDEEHSRSLCGSLMQLAADHAALVNRDAYRRSLDGERHVTRCRQLVAVR